MTSRRPRVLLITPPYHSGVVESAGVWMPLHFTYLAGHARAAGAEVRIYDAMSLGHTHERIQQEIELFKPDIVGVTAITAMEPDARVVCQSAKRVSRDILTVIGNVHAHFMWREMLSEEPALDVVVRSEGEETFADLVRCVAANDSLDKVDGIAFRKDGVPVANRPRKFAVSIDGLLPAWDLLDWPIYHYRPREHGRLAIVNSSRGCRQRCSFCSQQKFWERSWRGRDPNVFVSELEMLRDKFDVRTAMLSDETPTVDSHRWQEILSLLIDRQVGVELLLETRVADILRDEATLPRYRQAGISHIYIGVEATSQTTLDLYKKDLKVADSKKAIDLINDHAMVSETSFVVGTPDDTAESIKATIDLAKWYGPDMAFFLAITPWPYADLYPELAPYVATKDYRQYNLIEPVIQPKGMTLDEVRKALHHATGSFFHDKFKQLDKLSPDKRKYMIDVLKLLIEHSYLGKEMHRMAAHAEMPEAVKTMLRELAIPLPPARKAG